MKRLTAVGLLTGLIAVLNTLQVLAKDNPWEVGLSFKTAIIHYDIKGSQKGKETLYIRDYGNERVRITKSKGKVMFVETKTNTIEITTRDSVINIDREKNTGTRMTNPQKIMQEEIEKLSANERDIVIKNLEAIGMNMARQMGGEVKPNAGEHLGYTCDQVSIMGSTSCQISGTPILLKSESNIMGVKIKTMANKIDKNASIPAGVFQVPKDVNVTFSQEADDMNRQMIVSMIESMKDPEAAQKYEQGMEKSKQEMEAARRETEQERQAQETEETKQGMDDKDLDEMMQKGMESLKGLFK